ncbi:hypothetical protein [Comamonas composti]|uniref:hypothetical protein n=1 Tax=Comamonas composti TaxID=408558 RepID=UPI00047DD4D1|nr:hypothetical protein [Comamonas composti]
MLEHYSSMHQGLGLQAAARHPDQGLQVLAMLHDATRSQVEQDLLWPVCASLQRLGHSLLVLDASQSESAGAPGLLQLLDQDWLQVRAAGLGHQASMQTAAAEADALGPVAVLPARQGLAQLSVRAGRAGLAPMVWLQRYLRGYALVMVYAEATHLARALQGLVLTPLMALPEDGCDVLRCYRQLKQLAASGLRCLLAPLEPQPAETVAMRYDWGRSQSSALSQTQDARKRRQQIQALLQCAQRHLGQAPRLMPLRAGQRPDLQRLTLHLLNHAGRVPAPGGAAAGLASSPATSAWSH